MAAPEGGSSASPSLFSSIRSLWSVLLAILYTRIDLALLELKETGTHAIQLLVAGLAALLFAGMTVFFFFFFIIVLFWDHKEIVAGGIFGVCLFVSIILGLAIRNMIEKWPPVLSQSLAELRRDVEGLKVAAAGEKR